MEFLVRIAFRHLEVPSERFDALLAAEEQRALELKVEGLLVRVWRIPGTLANVGLWSAASPTHLHEALASLPLFPWFEITVEALAIHPLERLALENSAGA